MKKITHEFFLLLSNLVQVKNSSRIITIFAEAVNSYSKDFSIEFTKEKPENSKYYEINGSNMNFGYFKFSGNPENVSNEFKPLLQNAVQILSVILEKLEQEKELKHEKENLESLVEEKTASLKQSYSLLNEAQRLTKLGGWEWDEVNQTMFWTDEVYRLHGFDPDAVGEDSKKHIDMSVQCYDEKDRPVILEAFNKCRTEGVSFDYEFPFTTVTGEKIWIRTAAKPVIKNGKIVKIIGNFMDITDRKKIEKEKELLIKELKRKNNLKNQFMSNISHELRTPMNGILGFIEILKHTILDEKQKEYLEYISHAGSSLMNIINQLLNVVQIEAGKEVLDEHEIDMKKFIRNTAAAHKIAAASAGIIFNINISRNIPYFVVGDKNKLTHIFNNLLDNAVKFTHEGKIEISADILKREKNRVYLEFHIIDTGIGIPKDYHDDIFDVFSQVDGTYSRTEKGLGLGLSIVKTYVEFLGGEISVDSMAGEGTDFCVILPFRINKNNGVDKLEQPESVDKNLKQGKILLAEDDYVNSQLIINILRQYPYSVDIAENGLEAVDKVKDNDYDLILMDIKMPLMDGLVACRIIREGKCGKDKKDVPIAALTAYAMESDKEFFLLQGMSEYLPKPVDRDELLEIINKYIK